MGNPRKVFNYRTMYELLKAITERVKLASEQEERGEPVTACGMSNDDIADLCEDYLPKLFNKSALRLTTKPILNQRSTDCIR